MRTAKTPNQRIQLIDALRGLSIILVVAYHAGYDLVFFELVPETALYNPLLSVLQPLFAGLFILLSGVSARYSRDNRARGLRVLGCALIVSLVTGSLGMPITFGILHCLGLCMILCGNPPLWADRVPRRVQPWLSGALFFLFYIIVYRSSLTSGEFADGIPYLYMFGFRGTNFESLDYFPLLPWFFLFLFGVWMGSTIKEGRFPSWFYAFHVPVLPVVGRHTLLIYMLHQPVVFACVWGIARIIGEP